VAIACSTHLDRGIDDRGQAEAPGFSHIAARGRRHGAHVIFM